MQTIVRLSLVTAFLTAGAFAFADDNQPPHHHHGPPPEAVDACTKAKVGDTCSFTHRDHQIAGTCAAPPAGHDGPLACRPDHPPPRPAADGDGDGPPRD